MGFGLGCGDGVYGSANSFIISSKLALIANFSSYLLARFFFSFAIGNDIRVGTGGKFGYFISKKSFAALI